MTGTRLIRRCCKLSHPTQTNLNDSTMESMTFTAVGDISLGDSPYCFGFGVRSMLERADHRALISRVRELIRPGDLNFANLESVMSDIGSRSWSLGNREIRGDPSHVYILRAIGWNVLSIANNHIFQHGPDAFRHTLENLKKAGINPVGASGRAAQPASVVTNAGPARFLAYSLRPEQYAHQGDLPYANVRASTSLIEDVARARRDFGGPLICSLHWGLEFMGSPTREQQELGRSLIDSGADLIVGHHPHTLQGIEEYKNGLIAYSLGNFIFDITDSSSLDTGVLAVTFRHGRLESYNFRPATIASDYFPQAADVAEESRISNDVRNMSVAITTSNLPPEESLLPLQVRRYTEFRHDCYRFFLKNWYRYNPYFFFYSLCRAVLRRLRIVHNP